MVPSSRYSLLFPSSFLPFSFLFPFSFSPHPPYPLSSHHHPSLPPPLFPLSLPFSPLPSLPSSLSFLIPLDHPHAFCFKLVSFIIFFVQSLYLPPSVFYNTIIK